MGGNIFDFAIPIRKKYIEYTVNIFKQNTELIFPKVDFKFYYLGSALKKEVSNDIDLALSEETMIDKDENVKCEDWGIDRKQFDKLYVAARKRVRTATEKQTKLHVFVKIIADKLNENFIFTDKKKSVAGTLFCCYPQYDKRGRRYGDFVQIDINIGNIDWLLFSYYSENYSENVKGLHRTQLLVSLFANKKRTFRHGSGIFNLETNEYEAKTPGEAINLLNELYEFEISLTNLNDFYKLNDYLIKHISIQELYKIFDIYLKILDSTRVDIPEILQSYWIDNKKRLGLTGKFLPETSKLL